MNLKPILLATSIALLPSISYADHHGTKPDLCIAEEEFKPTLPTGFGGHSQWRHEGKTIIRYQKVDEYIEVYRHLGYYCIWDSNSDALKDANLVEIPSTLSVADGGLYSLSEEKYLVQKACKQYEIAQLTMRTMMMFYTHIDELVKKAEANRPEMPATPEELMNMTEEEVSALVDVDTVLSMVLLRGSEDLIDSNLLHIKSLYNHCKKLSKEFDLPEPIYHEHLRDIDYDHFTLNFEETNQ